MIRCLLFASPIEANSFLAPTKHEFRLEPHRQSRFDQDSTSEGLEVCTSREISSAAGILLLFLAFTWCFGFLGWVEESFLFPQASHPMISLQKPDVEKPLEAADKPSPPLEPTPAVEVRDGVENVAQGSTDQPRQDPDQAEADDRDTEPSAASRQVHPYVN